MFITRRTSLFLVHVPRTSGSVCGQDPRYCKDQLDARLYDNGIDDQWPDDITKWPVSFS